MPRIHEVRQLPYAAEQMFDLVADVREYPSFLPWVTAVRVRSDDGVVLTADMLVGFKALKERFTSRVTRDRPRSIRVHYVDGPLSDLDNRWDFRPLGPDRCEIEFCVEFAFKSRIFESLAGRYIDRAFRKMVAAFEARAAELYGSGAKAA
ncbi:type II toxin-antitoxin system RatA family toxin [Erythrobacteraceae bacterium CFH 75059]|uniref:type II toxin-antitoxin system RatA family toxin n=1 Tax=Qipengyuania thermophila TaxID=2509361 RepID=UPI00102062B2|nr:type II toxin-antitoxin system RatA family toxin [Qipengyuania thermophila]TCD05214.1 type II toxin-antitoxin system RatA family toxin [Erythrobacteraceae bacterium CFH 75059]